MESIAEHESNREVDLEPGPAIGALALERDTDDSLAGIIEALSRLAEGQSELREAFDAKIRFDEIQVKAIERLDEQMREYKANFIRQEMTPLLRDLIYCHDFADEEAGRARQPGLSSPEETALAFGHLRQMVIDVLAKYDVEPYRSAGVEFDRREQQCVATVPTQVPADDKKVAALGVTGFRLADAIIRKECVTVYKFTTMV